MQNDCGCIIGVDYPNPVVSHEIVSKVNMEKMKIAFSTSNGSTAQPTVNSSSSSISSSSNNNISSSNNNNSSSRSSNNSGINASKKQKSNPTIAAVTATAGTTNNPTAAEAGQQTKPSKQSKIDDFISKK